MKGNPIHIDGVWYHGGSGQAISDIEKNKIDVTLGGGELGQGFYVGNYVHQAAAWARHVYKNSNPSVVEIRVSQFSKSTLKSIQFSTLRAKEERINIRRKNAERTHLFKYDVVASPVVGKIFLHQSFTQLKWENTNSGNYLNSNAVVKARIEI